MQVIIAAGTGAAQSEPIEISANSANEAIFTAIGLAGAETAVLEKRNVDLTFTPYNDGTAAEMVVANPHLRVITPGIYRINKGVTAGAASVEMSTNKDP